MMSFIYVKSNSFLFLVPLQFWFLILYSSASTLMQWSMLQELCNQHICSRCLHCHIFVDAVAFDFCPFFIYHSMIWHLLFPFVLVCYLHLLLHSTFMSHLPFWTFCIINCLIWNSMDTWYIVCNCCSDTIVWKSTRIPLLHGNLSLNWPPCPLKLGPL